MVERTDFVEELKQKRDELRLKMHLGSMEAKEQWDALEVKWEAFAAKAGLRETSEDVEEGLQLIGAELAEGYDRIKAALTK